MPLATFPRVLASRGATSMRSAHLRRSMWRTGSDRHFHIWQREGNGVTKLATLSAWKEDTVGGREVTKARYTTSETEDDHLSAPA